MRVGEIFIRISEASYFLAQSKPHMSVVFYLPGKLHIDCKYLSPQTSRSLVNHKINKVIMNKGQFTVCCLALDGILCPADDVILCEEKLFNVSPQTFCSHQASAVSPSLRVLYPDWTVGRQRSGAVVPYLSTRQSLDKTGELIRVVMQQSPTSVHDYH